MGYMGGYNNYGGECREERCERHEERCERRNHGSSFALIVVLFILLIIVGATFMHHGY